MKLSNSWRQKMFKFSSNEASNACYLASCDWSQVLLPTWKVNYSRELFN
jgi:hypothetical protein